MNQTYFFYDLETSGLDSRQQRVMQFAGRRTNLDFEPIGKPYNLLVKLSDDILPDPQSILITKITPQMTLADGVSEHAFCKILISEIFTAGTIIVGFNNIRFDDEFIRNTLWRNFYDPYEWSYLDGRSRWDLLDVVRMTRALRPDDINWPVVDGKPANKLELIALENNLEHAHAHDALSDVDALIQVAKLLRDRQPKLFDYLLDMRDKNKVKNLVNLDEQKPFVYSSGRYENEFEKTTVAVSICEGSKPGSNVVYDLRYDPNLFKDLSQAEITTSLFGKREEIEKLEKLNSKRFPAKELSFNRCPAISPLGVLDDAAWARIGLDLKTVQKNYNRLLGSQDLIKKISDSYTNRPAYQGIDDVEGKLYDSFSSNQDKIKISAVRAADTKSLKDFAPQFGDRRLSELLLRYKAREFPLSLNDNERKSWEEYRSEKIHRNLPEYILKLQDLAKSNDNQEHNFVLEELKLWAESIL
jgi:exodeoxyribonuclease-1